MRSLLLVSALVSTACTRPSTGPEPLAEPPVAAAIEEPKAPSDPDRIRRLVLGDGKMATLNERGVMGFRGSTLFGDWIAAQGSIEDLWLGPGAVCVRTASGVACKVFSLNPFVGEDVVRLDLPSEAAVIDLDWSNWSSVCAVTSDGATWCSFSRGSQDNEPMLRFPISGAIDVEVHGGVGCARREDRSAVCWLDSRVPLGEFCKLEPGAPGCEFSHAAQLRWPGPSDSFSNTRDIAVGRDYACVLDEHGTPACHDEGKWGVGSVGKADAFMAIEGMPPLVEIDGGDRHVCGRSDEGEVWCWGANTQAQLGDGTTQSHRVATPVRVGSFAALDQLALDRDKSCVLADGRVECWGWLSETTLDPRPNEIPGVIASHLEVGSTTACARVDAGWKCWGGSAHTLAGVIGASQIVEAESGEEFNEGCRLDAGHLRCFDGEDTWLDRRGVIDVARASDPLCMLRNQRVECHEYYGEPPVVIRVPPSTSIQGTVEDGCVLTQTGEVHCWLEGEAAERLELPGKQVQVAMSYFEACALDDAGAVRCRGFDDSPPHVAAVTDVVELRAGVEHVCARTRAGKIACWGDSLVPFDVEAEEPSPEQPFWLELPAPALAFGLGDDYGCARLDDGRVFCWGSETSGQRARLSAEYVTRPTVITID